ncbi:Dephospho-CoA kinase [Armadillidium vulgare]|nr:Dephospho-CoA kinase [Armadillidium vulgare]
MFIVGLTGGIGTGKSVVATMIQDRGIKVIDADAIARQIVEPGQPASKKIEDGFGSGVFKENGEHEPEIQKQRLLDRKYSPEEARRRIEAQLPMEEKVELASFVIENSGSLSNTREQVEDILKVLRASRHHIWNKSLIFIALFVIFAILIICKFYN